MIPAAINEVLLGAAPLGLIVGAVLFCGPVVPTISVVLRRLHDAGSRGRWVLLLLVPVAGWVVLLVLLARPGQSGTNRYGPDPREDQRSVKHKKAGISLAKADL